ncbi:MAG TPA: S41 family peptidase [Bryobacterales bacterium]|nr:S41 family peptidase [Bryobacterales bacterium]
MRRSPPLRLPIAVLWPVLAVLVAARAATAPALTAEQRRLNVESFDYVWSAIRDHHWDPKLGGVDWDAARNELRPKVEQAGTMTEARAAMNDMISRLHQTHFGIVPAEVYEDIGPRPGAGREESGEGTVGIDVRVIGGNALVTSVEHGSPAQAGDVHPGWQIVRIDGAALEPVLRKVAETYKNSTMQGLMLSRAVTSKLDGKAGEKVRIEFLDGQDKTVSVEIAREQPRGARVQFGYLPVRYVWIESHRLGGNIGYIRFNFFLDPARLMAAFADGVKSCADCRGMIIDLRGNPGGIGVMAMGMAGWFLDHAGQELGTMYTREAPLKFVVNPRLETFGKPLAILVDSNSASTSEIFAEGMKDLHRARIFGTRTAGAALPSVFERLPNGDGFQYAIANYISEGGKPLEGVGVTPDVEAPLSREALLAGRDPVIDAAADWLRQTKEAQ